LLIGSVSRVSAVSDVRYFWHEAPVWPAARRRLTADNPLSSAAVKRRGQNSFSSLHVRDIYRDEHWLRDKLVIARVSVYAACHGENDPVDIPVVRRVVESRADAEDVDGVIVPLCPNG
jgi:hypothetical protein